MASSAPLDELDLHVRAAVLDDQCVTSRDVVDWFDVPRETALEAMVQLQRRMHARHPAHRE